MSGVANSAVPCWQLRACLYITLALQKDHCSLFCDKAGHILGLNESASNLEHWEAALHPTRSTLKTVWDVTCNSNSTALCKVEATHVPVPPVLRACSHPRILCTLSMPLQCLHCNTTLS